MDPVPLLACEQCKRRKLRCDKRSPCTACTTACLDCRTVQRARLPRGKTANARKNRQSIEGRLERIEALLERQQGKEPCSAKDSVGSNYDAYIVSPDTARRNLVAPEFWDALAGEIGGLRELLDSADEEEEVEVDVEGGDVGVKRTNQVSSTASLLFGRQVEDAGALTLRLISSKMRKKLVELYHYRVDTVYKFLHWPTVLSQSEKSGARSPPSVKALEYAIYFMALCSITDAEAAEMEIGCRQDVLGLYRSTVERLIAESRLLQNPDVTVLQAFVVYLIGLRTCLSGAFTWTLIAVAVRVATALRLGDEIPSQFSILDLEIRRRLLFTIGLLDTHSALDRGTVPIMPSKTFHTPPLSVNDSEVTPIIDVLPCESSGPTEMSHMLMTYDAMICQRRLFELSTEIEDGSAQWLQKVKTVNEFEHSIRKRAYSCCNTDSPLEKLKMISAEKIIISMQLLLHRPPYKQPHNSVPSWHDFNVMETATKVLESHMQPIPADLQPWAWKNWVQWHALAVVLAELMAHPQNVLSDRAYAVAQKSFHHYARIVADSESGMLWRPIAKLMRRVQMLRGGVDERLTQEVDGAHGAFEDSSRAEIDGVDAGMFGAPTAFNFDSWDGDSAALAAYPTPEVPHDGVHDAAQSEDMSWLTWTSFIDDLHQP